MLARRTSFGLIIAAVLAFGPGGSVTAETIEQRVVLNTSTDALTASLDGDSRMGVFTFSSEPGVSTGTLTVVIQDARGMNDGWNVTLESGDFRPVTGSAPAIPATGFQVVSDAGITADIGSPGGIAVVNTGVPLSTGPRVVRAESGSGTGSYAQKLNVQLAIPAWQPVGDYRSDVTVTIAAGPGETGV